MLILQNDRYKAARLLVPLLAAIAAAGVLFRLMFFGRTDIVWDEAWHVAIAYKIATVFWAQPLLLALPLALAAAAVYLLVVRRSVIAAAGIAGLLLLMSLALHVPFALHPRHPPLFNILAAIGIFLTGLAPDVIGKVISTAALIALPFFGLALGSHLGGRKTGIALFALLMLSPLSVFYSSTAFLNPLEVALCYGSAAVFFFALKNSRLMPIAGLLFAGAVATRYTAALMIFVFAYLILINRRWALSAENRNNCAVFAVVCIAAIGTFLPAMLSSFGGYAGWPEDRNFVIDLGHYSAPLADRMGGEPVSGSPGFYPEIMRFFFTPLMAVPFLLGAFFALKGRERNVLLFLAILLAYLAFFTLGSSYMGPRYALSMEFPLMVVSAYGISRLADKNRLAGYGLLAAMLLVFAWQNAAIIGEHDFRGLSGAIAWLPADANIYTSYLDSVKYYSGAYKTDTEISNRFFSMFSKGTAAKGGREIFYTNTPLEGVAERTDYVIASRIFLEKEKTGALGSFTLCREIKSGAHTVFWLYAREKCPGG